ncbi:MAG: hypothetical protein NZ903_03450, partial [Candidatus Micrarchaeota archaeon]|nr:hypothetical protein [Candidatus Micrarchaeota archaeon]
MYEILFSGWFALAVLVIFISLSLVALVYMISSALQNETYKKWAQNELYQVIASAFLLGSVFIFLAIINSIVLNIVPIIDPSLNFRCSADRCSFYVEKIEDFMIGRQIAVEPKMEIVECKQGYCHVEVAKSMLSKFYEIIRVYTANKIAEIGWLMIFKGIKISVFTVFTIEPFAGLQPVIDIYSAF